ncbi:MAG: mechanosensitive ion channel family protein, partial [Burkholderiales bacterium]|nr:mechanosensitive ion channel family protein [Burkholderiales bacterium]
MDDLVRSTLAAWDSLGGVAVSAARIAGIVLLAWLAVAVAQRGIRTLRMRISTRLDDREAAKRAETLGRVVRYRVAVVVTLIAGMLVLAELG